MSDREAHPTLAALKKTHGSKSRPGASQQEGGSGAMQQADLYREREFDSKKTLTVCLIPSPTPPEGACLPGGDLPRTIP